MSTEKLMADIENKDADTVAKGEQSQINKIKLQQDQQKIDQDAMEKMDELALKLTDMEQKYQTQLNAEFTQNTLVFDPATGGFVNA